MKETKKVVAFVVELYELDGYWHTENGYAYKYDCDTGLYNKVKATRYFLTPSCYKRTYYERFNSVRKLNEALGLKKKNFYSFYTCLEDAIKGAHGDGFYVVRNRNDRILIVRQLHALDIRYTYYQK